MGVNEAIAIQTPEMVQAGGTQEAGMPAEGSIAYQRANGTIEQATSREDAIARCPVLGRMPVEQAEVLLELAAEGSEQLAREAQEGHTRTSAESEKDSKFAPENRGSESGLFEDLPSEPGSVIAQFDRKDAAAQEEIQKRRSLNSKSNVRRKRGTSKENSDHVVDIDDVVRRVIAANPQARQDFRSGNTGALDILVNEAMQLSKATN